MPSLALAVEADMTGRVPQNRHGQAGQPLANRPWGGLAPDANPKHGRLSPADHFLQGLQPATALLATTRSLVPRLSIYISSCAPVIYLFCSCQLCPLPSLIAAGLVSCHHQLAVSVLDRSIIEVSSFPSSLFQAGFIRRTDATERIIYFCRAHLFSTQLMTPIVAAGERAKSRSLQYIEQTLRCFSLLGLLEWVNKLEGLYSGFLHFNKAYGGT